jgi:hypothetical protein
MYYNSGMAEPTKEKTKLKQLPCGGYAVYGTDVMTKQEAQVGYIGAKLPLEGYAPKDHIIVK